MKAVLAGAFAFLLSPLAWAGCPSQCNASAETSIDPPLPCLVITADASGSCGCDARVTVENHCQTSVTAVDFTFRGCTEASDPYGARHDCTELAPGDRSYEYIELKGNGEWDFGYTVQNGESEHEVHIVTHVKNFDDDLGYCQLSWAAPSSTGALGSAVVLLGALLGRRRAARARSDAPR